MLKIEFIKKIKEIKKDLQNEDAEQKCFVYSRNNQMYYEIYEGYLNSFGELIVYSE